MPPLIFLDMVVINGLTPLLFLDSGWQVSFCNSIATIRGGTHVQYVADQIVSHVMGIVNKKNKTAGVKPFQIKNHMWVFVNALIDNPTFDSQTKETLTTRSGSFGSKCELSAEFMKKGTSEAVV